MRLYSTPQSAENRDPSVLALLETVAACSVAIWLATKWGSLTWLVVTSGIAPVLLLRTTESMKLGIALLEGGLTNDRTINISLLVIGTVVLSSISAWQLGPYSLLWAIPTSAVVSLVSLPSAVFLGFRVYATISRFVRSPSTSIHAIPGNWFQYAMCTDTAYPPELVPGVELRSDESFTFWGSVHAVTAASGNWIELVLSPFVVLFGFLPSLLYRWSLKATSVVWVPLIWLFQISRWQSTTPTEDLVDDLRLDAISRLQRAWGLLIIVTFAATMTLDVAAASVAKAANNASPTLQTLMDLYLPRDLQFINLKGWQIARVLNAALFLGLSWYAFKVNRRWPPRTGDKGPFDEGTDFREGWEPETVRMTFDSVSWVALALSCYTWTCSWLVLLRFAITAKVPPMKWEWLPTW